MFYCCRSVGDYKPRVKNDIDIMRKVNLMEEARKQNMMNRAVSDISGGASEGVSANDFESVLLGSSASKTKAQEDADAAASGKLDARRTRFAIQMCVIF